MATQTLKGKTAIVTGAGKPSGIGAAIALILAEHGANVSQTVKPPIIFQTRLTRQQILVHYSSSAGPAQEVVAAIQRLGVQAIAVQADATQPSFGTTLVSAALKHLNTTTIDIIVNNAGTAAVHAGGISSVPISAWDEIYHVNVRAPFTLIQAALPHMPRGSRIVNIGSIAAKLGHEWLTVYASAKGALNAMTVSMAQELGPKDITINVLAPGPIKTEMSMAGTPIFAKLMTNAHIKREGTTREVAEAALFLASPGAGYITGQVLAVDGGINLP